MITVTKTKAGWVLEINNEVNDCLEQGGFVGRRELYKKATLGACGIDYNDDPEGEYSPFTSNIQMLYRQVPCDKVLNSGEIIQ